MHKLNHIKFSEWELKMDLGNEVEEEEDDGKNWKCRICLEPFSIYTWAVSEPPIRGCVCLYALWMSDVLTGNFLLLRRRFWSPTFRVKIIVFGTSQPENSPRFIYSLNWQRMNPSIIAGALGNYRELAHCWMAWLFTYKIPSGCLKNKFH